MPKCVTWTWIRAPAGHFHCTGLWPMHPISTVIWLLAAPQVGMVQGQGKGSPGRPPFSPQGEGCLRASES